MLPPSAAAAATTMSDADRYCFTMRDPDRVRPATSDPDRYCLAPISEIHGLLSLDTVHGGAQDVPMDGPADPRGSRHNRIIYVLGISAIFEVDVSKTALRRLQDSPRWHQDAPRQLNRAQDGPMIVPRWLQDAS